MFECTVDIMEVRIFWEHLLEALKEISDKRIEASDKDFVGYDLDKVYTNFVYWYGMELSTMFNYALRVSEGGTVPRVSMCSHRFAGRDERGQFIVEFATSDTGRTNDPSKLNWHGQNTSQWVYAGAIVVDLNDGRVSTHH
jgi:hypothetical protein